jgi:class 3 adenylate cyclase
MANGPNFMDLDVSELASQLTMPVLVVRHLGFRWLTDDITHDLVATIPDARLVTMAGLWPDEPEAMVRRIAEFVYDGAPLPDSPERVTSTSGVRTVLFTDLVGHTELMRRLGDDAGRAVLREHEGIVRGAIARHGGAEIKTDGDSFMVSFGSVARPWSAPSRCSARSRGGTPAAASRSRCAWA